MFGRTIMLATAVLSGLAASQAPEFAQQYRQRLGGAVDELGLVIADFDRDATKAGLEREQAIAVMKNARETLVHLRGISMEAAIDRYDRLALQRIAFERSGPIRQVETMLASPDRALVQATFADYQPAVPTTPAGAIAAGLGFALVYAFGLLAALLILPFRLLRRAQLREMAEPF